MTVFKSCRCTRASVRPSKTVFSQSGAGMRVVLGNVAGPR